jgi:hypothetical protein
MEVQPAALGFMNLRFNVLQRGYCWQIVGLLLFFGVGLFVQIIGSCDPFEDCDIVLPGFWGGVSMLAAFLSPLLGIGFYWVGAAHIFISPVSPRHKLLAICLPLLLIGITLVVVTRGLP